MFHEYSFSSLLNFIFRVHFTISWVKSNSTFFLTIGLTVFLLLPDGSLRQNNPPSRGDSVQRAPNKKGKKGDSQKNKKNLHNPVKAESKREFSHRAHRGTEEKEETRIKKGTIPNATNLSL